MAQLGWYIQDATSLLHDQSNLFTPRNQLVRWVNEARRQCAQRTGCIQRHVTGQSAFGASMQPGAFIPGGAQPGALPGSQPNALANNNATQNTCATIPGVERYSFQGFFNPLVRQAHAGVKGIVDVASCSVNWGGAVRPSLAWMPWEDLQAFARAYATLVTSYPYYWSVLNDGENGEIFFFPAPSFVGDIELDAYCVPLDLQTDADYDAIPDGFSNAIKFGAASLAFFGKQQYLQAQIMENMFAERLGVARVSADRGKIPNFYYNSI